MSYEFNPDSKLFEFPNPYKVENLAWLTAGGLFTLAGIGTLVAVRERIAHGADLAAIKVVVLSILLMLMGFVFLARAFVQLRYFFGRNRPSSLAPLIPPDKDDDSGPARAYKEILRQNALIYREPKGPINGLLYSMLPSLIFAPEEVRKAAQSQFYNFLSLSATFVSFMICWLAFGQGAAAGWIGLAYGTFAFLQILRPMAESKRSGGEAEVGTGALVGLIVVAVLGPVILGMVANRLPALGDLAINGVVFAELLCALAGCAIFGMALKNQLLSAPEAVGTARVAETVTMNAHPNKLIEELDRILLSRWYNNIPNRRYTRRSPQINGRQGQFTAELFEETQPRPQANRVAEGLGHALSSPRFFWLTCLTAFGLVCVLAGGVGALLACAHILDGAPVASTLEFAISQLAVGWFCLKSAHKLWGRFDFVSELIWVDISGSYESAQMHIGNQMTSQVHSSKNVINVESMTMRVWVSEIDTVIFGKDGARQMVGMRGLPALAEEIAATLKGFGETRSAIVAPASQEDLARARDLAMLAKVAGGPADAAELEHQAAPESSAIAAPAACKQCGTSLAPEVKFCGECGARA